MSFRSHCSLIVTTLLVIGCQATAAFAAVIHVPGDYATIQAAINAAGNGDTIQVAPGTYVENLNFLGKAIQVTSDQGAQLTVIDGNQAGSVVSFVSGEGPQSILSGFTLSNGRAAGPSGYRGGGVRIENSSPTITGNIITNNTAGDGGGGISSSFGSPVIQGNMITNNGQIPGYSGGVGGGGISIGGASAAQVLNNAISGNSWSSSSGGGITLFAAGTPVLRNNFITNNSAYSQGGGVWIVNYSDALLVQNVITGNSAGAGGGVYWMVPSGNRGPTLTNNTIADNNSPQGSALFADGFDGRALLINNILVSGNNQSTVACGTYDTNTPVLRFNDVFSVGGLPYAGACANQTGSNGNISTDPLFRAAGDYHLQNGSPAIDAGTSDSAPTADLEGRARPVDGNDDGIAAVDMGVYEAPSIDMTAPVTTASASPNPNAAGWNKTNTTVTLSATDNSSGVQFIRYWLTGAQTAPTVIAGNPTSVTITAEGATTVGYSAVDNAGNNESSKSFIVNIDKTAPVISGMPAAGCTLAPAKHQLVTVATITATDARSGLASLNITAISSEPDSGTGGGDLPGDIVINDGTVQLRAERSPSGKGRTYTITATATDVAGNVAMITGTCQVPK